jgi:hypothetical protein
MSLTIVLAGLLALCVIALMSVWLAMRKTTEQYIEAMSGYQQMVNELQAALGESYQGREQAEMAVAHSIDILKDVYDVFQYGADSDIRQLINQRVDSFLSKETEEDSYGARLVQIIETARALADAEKQAARMRSGLPPLKEDEEDDGAWRPHVSMRMAQLIDAVDGRNLDAENVEGDDYPESPEFPGDEGFGAG